MSARVFGALPRGQFPPNPPPALNPTSLVSSYAAVRRFAFLSASIAAADTLATSATETLRFVAAGGVNLTFELSRTGAIIGDIPISGGGGLSFTGA